MSGHSKWSTIKRKKGAIDAKRSKIFTKIIKEISVASKMGGSSIDANSRLRSAVAWAKAENMPSDNIARAIKKGAGEMDNVQYEEITYEGFGPEGVAVMVECLTDNKNRSVASVRSIFNKNGGTMGGANSVAHSFERKGVILVPKEGLDEDTLTMKAIDAGSEDIDASGAEHYSIVTEPGALHKVEDYLNQQGIETESAKLDLIPVNTVSLDNLESAAAVVRLIDQLEDDDDVQNVYANMDIPDDIAAAL